VGCAALALPAALLAGAAQPVSAGHLPQPVTAGATRLAPAPNAFGLTVTGKLVRFRLNDPAGVTLVGTVVGLGQDYGLVGIDIRPQGRALYGIGDRGGVFTVDKATAAATNVGRLDDSLVGLHFGLDIDPVEDEIRVVSNAGQNISYHPDSDATTVDHLLVYPPSTTTARGAVGLAYTNSDTSGSTGTGPYVLDVQRDQLARVSSEPDGALRRVGALGVDASGEGGFDAVYALRGYAVLRTAAGSGLYTVNLGTGAATLVGMFPATMKVVDLAVPMPQP